MLDQQNLVSSGMPAANLVNMSRISNALLVRSNSLEWIIGTDVINHMVRGIDLLDKGSIFEPAIHKNVALPNGKVSYVTHTGCSSIYDNSTLDNVLHLPQFRYDLLSMSQATKQLKCVATFLPNVCVFQDL